MSQPHHFVFNELERVIRSSVPNIETLLDLLVEKNVVLEADKTKFIGKHGMKCLTSYLRIKKFEVFVTFLECVRDVSRLDPTVDHTILETIRGAVKTFDENHGTSFEDRIPTLKLMETQSETSVATLSTGIQVASTSAPQFPENQPLLKDEMDILPLVGIPVQVTIDHKGGKLSSPLNDFVINIPPGVICKGEKAMLRAATCAYGTFSTPNDAYRISDFVCISSDKQFLSPITFRLAHCLRMPEYKNTAAVVMLHTDFASRKDSGEFVFSALDCFSDVSSTEPFISVSIRNFCVFCAAYYPKKYRGVQRNQSCEKRNIGKQTQKANKQRALDSPYTRPTVPSLDYLLLFYEHKEKKSPFKLQVFACLDCPGSIELINRQMKKQLVWKPCQSKNFDFTSSKVIVLDVTRLTESKEWDVSIKFQSIAEHDIQRYKLTKRESLDANEVKSYEETQCYPPKMTLEVTAVSPNASYFKFRVMIKDAYGKDGDCVLNDSYEVLLPAVINDTHGDGSSVNVNRQQHPTDFQRPLIKRSLSAEEEECLDKPLTDCSIPNISNHIKYWRNVARGLTFTDVAISHLESDHRSESVVGQTYHMLREWKRRSVQTSFRVIVEILKQCNENDAVNFILDNILSLSTEPTKNEAEFHQP